MIHYGDCLEVMAAMEPESVDAIVTDPPYGLEFMGKKWDRLWAGGTGDWAKRPKGGKSPFQGAKGPAYVAGTQAQAFHASWAEAAYRVAKPSAYLLAFGGTRTVHRMTVALEDAGWIIRDMLVWAYASGFPKSKASLKPAWEPIVMARKPGPLRMLAIDACRIPFTGPDDEEFTESRNNWRDRTFEGPAAIHVGERAPKGEGIDQRGRWPANLVLTDPIFDGGVAGVVGGGEQNSPATYTRSTAVQNWGVAEMHLPGDAAGDEQPGYGDSGTYSRFFLIPKADRADREPVLGGLPVEYEHSGPRGHVLNGDGTPRPRPRPRENVHPTVKPTELMRHLVRLVTPSGGTVLDPFLGSGSTGLACELEGFPWIGIEKEAEYVAIAEARLNGTQRGLGLVG